ncbi:MAG: hypothetical protein GYB65_22835 [Chloroflexi bacterium]|nr:hypothetical protein [Chloroflexota bacterium]
MESTHSIFFEEWRACLRAHYMHVVRSGDTIAEPTLRQVLVQAGLRESELDAIRDEVLAEGAAMDEAAFDDDQAQLF